MDRGIEVGDLRYFGSQSWPFPHSLMLGFFATWKSGEIAIDKAEIVDARWFGADELSPKVVPHARYPPGRSAPPRSLDPKSYTDCYTSVTRMPAWAL